MNYHHLRLFWMIARSGGVGAAARELHLSASAVSIQLRTLEDRLGHRLFDRLGRRMVLTEAGRIALDYADTIFAAGDELKAVLAGAATGARRLRVGAQTTLSRNFQTAFLAPVLSDDSVTLTLRSGSLRVLVADLEAQLLDVVLSNEPAPTGAAGALRTVMIDEQPVAFVGAPGPTLRFPDDIRGLPVIIPSRDSDIRRAFDRLCTASGYAPDVHAEVDDMALMRVIARDTGALTLVPPIVVRDELASGALAERCRPPNLTERFYALVPIRRFANPVLELLVPAQPAAVRR